MQKHSQNWLVSIIVLMSFLGCKETDFSSWRKKHQDEINTRAIKSGLPTAQTHPHVISKTNDGSVYSSRALSQGEVVGVFNYSYPVQTGSGKTYFDIKYVVVSFLAESSLLNGKITKEAVHNTEVWKFVDDSTCPIITNLNTNTKATALRNVELRPDGQTIRLQIFTGSAAGIPGEIAFDDTNPLEQDCQNIKANPIINTPWGLSFYSAYEVGNDPTYPQAPTSFYNQAIRKIKLTQFSYYNTRTEEYVVQFLTNNGCIGPLDAKNNSGCAESQTIMGTVWVARFNRQNSVPGKLPLFMLFDPHSSDLQKLLYSSSFDTGSLRPIVDVDMTPYLTDSPTAIKGLSFVRELSIIVGQGNNYALTTSSMKTQISFTNHAPALNLTLVAPRDFNSDANSSWKYNYRMTNAYVWFDKLLTAYAPDYFPTEVTPIIGTTLSIQNMVMGPNGYACKVKKAASGQQQCDEIITDYIGVTDRTIVPWEFKQIKKSYAYQYGGSKNPRGFQGVINFARPQPYFYFDNYGLTNQPLNTVAFRAVPTSLNKSTNKLSLRMFSPSPIYKGQEVFINDIPNNFSSIQFRHDKVDGVAPDGYMSFDITDPQIYFSLGVKKNQPNQFYILFTSMDRDKTQYDGKSRTGGGVFLCVANVNPESQQHSHNDISLINFSDCNKARPTATADNPFPTGYSIITADDISNNGSFLTSPKQVSMYANPQGDVILDYIAANNAIYTVNATTKTGNNIKNWNRKSVGRSAECHQVLKNINNSSSFWTKALGFTDSVLLSSIIAATEPEGGIFIEIGWDFLETFVIEGEPKELQAADLMRTTCTVH